MPRLTDINRTKYYFLGVYQEDTGDYYISAGNGKLAVPKLYLKGNAEATKKVYIKKGFKEKDIVIIPVDMKIGS